MKSYHLEVLKQIAMLGGVHEFISLSGKKLGEALGISQQSASKRVIELIEMGMAQRDWRGRRQMVRLTGNGLKTLEKEYGDYRRIFEMKESLSIKGAVVSGLGEGRYYVQRPEYFSQFVERLGFRPFIGTLNLKLEAKEIAKLDILKGSQAVVIRGFKDGERSFGDVMAFPAALGGLECAIIIPARSHYSDVLEVVSPHHLRKRLHLKDGTIVELNVKV